MSLTYQAKKKKRKKKHGFLKHQATKSGRKVIAKRRAKQRKRISV